MADRSPATAAWALWKMARPAQLLLVATVYAVGATSALALEDTAAPGRLVAGLAVLLPISASVHYANEFADYETDLLTTRTPFSGGSGALARTGLPRRLPLLAALAALAVGAVGAVGLVAGGRLSGTALALLAVGGAFGWQYSVGPLALARRGLGELDNALLGGLVLPLYGYAVATGDVTPAVAVAYLPFASLVFLNLLATTWPDRRADAAVGKRTLAVRWSPPRLRATYALGAAAWGGVTLAVRLPTPVAVGTLAVAPLVVWGGLTYTRRESPLPSVAAMVAAAVATGLGWGVVAFG